MTEKQRQLARHALGLPNKKNESYRNYFCAGVGHPDYAEWEDMVAHGYAVKRTVLYCGGDDMFHLTLKGGLLAQQPGEHVSIWTDAASMRSDAVVNLDAAHGR